MKLRNIQILENDRNKKGDLFGRLMGDLFHALGYGEPRFNIHKSGREVDIQAHHRTEKKVAIAECKAHRTPIGGPDINKFVGVLNAERIALQKKDAPSIEGVGYFVSISGFNEAAIEQEETTGNTRVILLGSRKIADELVNGRIIVSPEKAVSVVKYDSEHLSLLEEVDLFAYERGWVWGLYFSDNDGQKATHFSLVHADGKPLIKDLAYEIIERDNSNLKLLMGLQYVFPPKDIGDIEEAKSAYFKYLENECGEIQFEGLPTDKDAAVKVKLENIFVPLHLDPFNENREKGGFEFRKRDSVGGILHHTPRLAILAKPGGGKSTLIKRIALAYAFKGRREEVDDNLPDLEWFPIFIRCRELGEQVGKSITETILNIPNRAEIGRFKDQFSVLVSDALQKGSALLLIDGLDEITEDRKRIAFVNQLRTFLATYPNINIIVTSREAGFRAVAGSLSTYCEHYTIAKLNNDEITDLTIKWHKAVIDNSEKTIGEARSLANQITREMRIKVLAENPLLLTTLLFVKRWIGYLPTKKHILYQEMIKLLLVTWNVEGHEQLDIEESEPQLAYVAYWLTVNGKQTINETDLKKCLADARRQMPEILAYSKVSISEFIKNVETRSSLLIMSGHENVEDDHAVPIYEFLHLSFQEYLTAKAIVEGYLPNRDRERPVLEIVKPHVEFENWREVIPLVAVLSRTKSKEVVSYLRDQTMHFALGPKPEKILQTSQIPSLLLSCLSLEVQISEDLLESSFEWIAKSNVLERRSLDLKGPETILNGKFADIFREKIKNLTTYSFDDRFVTMTGSVLGMIQQFDWRGLNDDELISDSVRSLNSGDKAERCSAILGLMNFAWSAFENPHTLNRRNLAEIYSKFVEFLESEDKHLQFYVCWCIAWFDAADFISDTHLSKFPTPILHFWLTEKKESEIRRIIEWALIATLRPSTSFDQFSLKRIEENLSRSSADSRLLEIYFKVILNQRVNKEVAGATFAKNSNNVNKKGLIAFAKRLGINLPAEK